MAARYGRNVSNPVSHKARSVIASSCQNIVNVEKQAKQPETEVPAQRTGLHDETLALCGFDPCALG